MPKQYDYDIENNPFLNFKVQSARDIAEEQKAFDEKVDYEFQQANEREQIDDKVTDSKINNRRSDVLFDGDGEIKRDSQTSLNVKEAWNAIAPQFLNVDGYIDGRKVNLDNKNIDSLFNGDSLSKVAADIRDAPEDPEAKAVFYYYKQYDGKDGNGEDKFLYKPGVSATGAWDREREDMKAKGLELVFEKRMAGAEALENRVQALAIGSDAVDQGNVGKGGISYGSGYTELKDKDVLGFDNENIDYYENIKASKEAKLAYDKEGYGLDDGLEDAFTAGAISLAGKVGDGILTIADAAIDGVLTAGGLGEIELQDNIFDDWEKNADKIAGYDRRGSTAVMKESLYLWKHGDKFGAVFNDLGTKSEMVAESMPEMILMSMSAGSASAALKASKYAKQMGTLNAELTSARLMKDSVKGAERIKQLRKIQQNTLNKISKDGLDASKIVAMNEIETATSLIRMVGQQHGFNAVVAGSTNKIIEERMANGDKDVTMGEALAIGASQYLLLGMDRMSFESIVGSRKVLDSFKSAFKFSGDSTKKKVLSSVASGAAAVATEMGQEGVQEYLQTWGEIMGKDLGVDGKGFEDVYSDQKNQDEALTAGIMGAASGGIMSGTMTGASMAKDVVTSSRETEGSTNVSMESTINDIASLADPEIRGVTRRSALYNHLDNTNDKSIDDLSDEAVPDMISSLDKNTGDKIVWKVSLDYLEQNRDEKSDAIMESILNHQDLPQELKNYRSKKAAMNLGTEISAIVAEEVKGSFTGSGKENNFDEMLSGEGKTDNITEPGKTVPAIIDTLSTLKDKYEGIVGKLKERGEDTSLIEATISTLSEYIDSDGVSLNSKTTDNVRSEIYDIGYVDTSKKKWWRPGLTLYKEALSSLINTDNINGSKNGISLNTFSVFMKSRINKKYNRLDRNTAANIIGENKSINSVANMVVTGSKQGVPESFTSAMNELNNSSAKAVDSYYNGGKDNSLQVMHENTFNSAIEYIKQAKTVEELDKVREMASNVYIPREMAIELFNAEVQQKLALDPAKQNGPANEIELLEIMSEIASNPNIKEEGAFNRFSELINRNSVPKEAIDYMKHVAASNHGVEYNIDDLEVQLESAENPSVEYQVITKGARLSYDHFIRLGKKYQEVVNLNRDNEVVSKIESATNAEELFVDIYDKKQAAYLFHVKKAIANGGKVVSDKMQKNALKFMSKAKDKKQAYKLLAGSGKYRFSYNQVVELAKIAKEKTNNEVLGDADERSISVEIKGMIENKKVITYTVPQTKEEIDTGESPVRKVEINKSLIVDELFALISRLENGKEIPNIGSNKFMLSLDTGTVKRIHNMIKDGKHKELAVMLQGVSDRLEGKKNDEGEAENEVLGDADKQSFSTAEIEQDIKNINWFKENMKSIPFEGKELSAGELKVLEMMRDRIQKEADAVVAKIEAEKDKIKEIKKMSTTIETNDPILVKIKKIKIKIKALVAKFKIKIKAIRDRIKKLNSTKKEFDSMIKSIDTYLEARTVRGNSKKKISEISSASKSMFTKDKREVKESATKLSRAELKAEIAKDLGAINKKGDSSSLRSSLKNKILALSKAKASFAVRMKAKQDNIFKSIDFMGEQSFKLEDLNLKVKEIRDNYLIDETKNAEENILEAEQEVSKYYDDNFEELDRATKAADRITKNWRSSTKENLVHLPENELNQIQHAREMLIEINSLKKKVEKAKAVKLKLNEKKRNKIYTELLKIVKKKKFVDELIKQASEDASSYDKALIAYSNKVSEVKRDRKTASSGAKELIDLALSMVSISPSDLDILFLKKKFKRSKREKGETEYAGSETINKIPNKDNQKWFTSRETPLSSVIGILDGTKDYSMVVDENNVDERLTEDDIEAVFEIKDFNDKITLSEPATNEFTNADNKVIKGKSTSINSDGKVTAGGGTLFKLIDILSLNNESNKYEVQKNLETAIKTTINAYLVKHQEIKVDILASSDEDIISDYGVSPDKIDDFKQMVIQGNIPIATARKEILNIAKDILGISVSKDADIKLKNTLDSGLSALIEAHLFDGKHAHENKMDVGSKQFTTYRPVKKVDPELILAMRALSYLTLDSKRMRPVKSSEDLSVDEKIMNSDSMLTQDKKDLIDKNQKTAWFFNENIQDFYKEYSGSEEGKLKVLKVFGYREIDYDTEHISDIELKQALNEKAERETEILFLEYMELGHEQFHVKWGVTKSLRATIKSDLNIQESKIHRIFAAVKQFTTELSGVAKKRNPLLAMTSKELSSEEMIEVYLHQGFEMDPDKKSVLTVLRELREVVDIYEPGGIIVGERYTALKAFIEAKDFDLDLLLKAKEENGRSMHSVQALMMLRQLHTHKRSGSTRPFVTTMTGEADAITSGSALLALSIGTAPLVALLEKAGVYTHEGKKKWEEYVKHILQIKYKEEYGEDVSQDDIELSAGALIEAGNYHRNALSNKPIITENNQFKEAFADVYMTVGMAATEEIKPESVAVGDVTMQKFAKIIFNSDGTKNLNVIRFIFKDPTMIFNYGALLGKILFSFARSVIGEEYKNELLEANAKDAVIPESIIRLYYQSKVDEIHKKGNERDEKDPFKQEDLNKAYSMLLSDTSMYKVYDDEAGYSRKITQEELRQKIDNGESLNRFLVISDDMINAIKKDLDDAGVNSGIKDSFDINFGDISKVRDGGKILDIGVSAIFKFKFKQKLEQLKEAKGDVPVTSNDVIEIIYNLEKEGFGHTIDGEGRVQPLYKEDNMNVSERGYAKVGDSEASVNFKSISFKDNSGAAVTINVHANDAEIIAKSLDSGDFMSIYDAAILGTNDKEIKQTAEDYGRATIEVSMKNRFFHDYATKLSNMIKGLSVDDMLEVALQFDMFKKEATSTGLKKVSKDAVSKFRYLGLLDFKNRNDTDSEFSFRLSGDNKYQKQRLTVMGGAQEGFDLYTRREEKGDVTTIEYYYGTDENQSLFRRVTFTKDGNSYIAEVETGTNENKGPSSVKAKYSGVKEISHSFEMDKDIIVMTKLNVDLRGRGAMQQKLFANGKEENIVYTGNKILDFLKVDMLDTTKDIAEAFRIYERGVESMNQIDGFHVDHMHLAGLHPEFVEKGDAISDIKNEDKNNIFAFLKVIQERNKELLLEYIDKNFTSEPDIKKELMFRVKNGRPSLSSDSIKDLISNEDKKSLYNLKMFKSIVAEQDVLATIQNDMGEDNTLIVNNVSMRMPSEAKKIISEYLNDKNKGC